MGIMSEIDIMRREGAREPEDFMAHGYNRKDAEAMSEVVKAAEKATVTCGHCENQVSSGVEYCVECLTAMIHEQCPAEIVQRAETPTREARLEAAVQLILAIEYHRESNLETVRLTPRSRRQLQEALKDE